MSDAAAGQAAEPAIEIFYSYAQEDEELYIELNKHLALLRKQGYIRGCQRGSISTLIKASMSKPSHCTSEPLPFLRRYLGQSIQIRSPFESIMRDF